MKTLKDILSWRWLMLLLAAVALSTSLTACGDDDDDDESGAGSDLASKIIGTWVEYDDEDYYDDDIWGYTFKSNGKGFGFEYWNTHEEEWEITWKVRDNRIILTDVDGDQEVLIVKKIDETYMTAQFEGDYNTTVFKKVKTNW